MKFKLFYIFYSLLLIVLSLLHCIDKILNNTGGPVSRYTPLVFTILVSIGLWSYVFDKTTLAGAIWKYLFWVLILCSVFSTLLVIYLLVDNGATLSLYWLMALILFLFPAEFGLYNYAYRRDVKGQ